MSYCEEMDVFEPQWFDDRTGAQERYVRAEPRNTRNSCRERCTSLSCARRPESLRTESLSGPRFVDTPEIRGRETPVRWSGVRCWGTQGLSSSQARHRYSWARIIVSMAVWQRARPWSLMALDVSCAFFYAQSCQGDLH